MLLRVSWGVVNMIRAPWNDPRMARFEGFSIDVGGLVKFTTPRLISPQLIDERRQERVDGCKNECRVTRVGSCVVDADGGMGSRPCRAVLYFICITLEPRIGVHEP